MFPPRNRRRSKPTPGFATFFAQGLLAWAALGIGTAAQAADDLAGVPAETYAEFMAGEVLDVEDLAEGAEIQRLIFNRITPPGMSWLQPMFPTVVPFDAARFEESFLENLLGEDRNSVAIYPLSLALDPETRETLVCNADGKLIATLPAGKASRAWPEDADPSRVTLRLDLLPSEDVEPYLYVESRVAESLAARAPAKSPRTGGPAKRSLGASEFGICDIQELTNGNVRLTVSNGTDVAELYFCTVAHTSSVVVGIWTNEEDEVIWETNTLWTAVSPSFNGIDSAWECATTNLACTNGVGAWEDADIPANARVRFYAAARRTDFDADGLTGGAEILLHRTDPGVADSDGDDLSDGGEVNEHGTDPLDPDTDDDGLPDGEEVNDYGTDPLVEDTDTDGLPDGWEVEHGFNPLSGMSSELAAWYRFDEGTGVAIHDSASGIHTGVLLNATAGFTNWVAGCTGRTNDRALWFDGTNDYVAVSTKGCGSVVTQAPFTVGAWVFQDPLSTHRMGPIVSDSGHKNYNYCGYLLRTDAHTNWNSAGFYVGCSSNCAYSLQRGWTNSWMGRWVHLVGTYDGTRLKLYANGSLIETSHAHFQAETNAALWIGRDHVNAEFLWRGAIDDVRIYRGALSAQEVADLNETLADADGDGLSNLAECQAGTDPRNSDTDGDGAGDGDEAGHGTGPANPASFPVNEALEAALADVNVAQIGYLSYLTGATFDYDPATNYAQRIQQLRDALEGMAGSFLDTDVNTGGVLAEGSNVVTWALGTVLASAGSSSGNWLGGLASTSQVEEAVAVLGKLIYITNVVTSSAGYPHQSVANNDEPVQIGDTWDLGTGYPDGWPSNQPIKTYLLLDTKVEILNVGLGTVDDWIEVNGTARFPGSGEIYSSHIADITPVWNPQGANSLALWDCGDCAGDNNFAYLSPFKVVQVLEIPILKVDFTQMWETENKANRIFNPTRKDDPVDASASSPYWDENEESYGVPRNKIYLVPDPDDFKYKVTVKAVIEPANIRTDVRAAAYIGSEKVVGSDTAFDASGECALEFTHTGNVQGSVQDFVISVGYDSDGDGILDNDEIMPFVVKNTATGEMIGNPVVKGSSAGRYSSAKSAIDNLVSFWGTEAPRLEHARALLRIFRDGYAAEVPTEKQPSDSSNSSFNAFSGYFAEWLTHNSGATFDDSGNATLTEYYWDEFTSLADLVATAPQIEDPVSAFYYATVYSVVTNYFAGLPAGTIATFPSPNPEDGYTVTHASESPAWVAPGAYTIELDTWVWNKIDEVNGTVGRGRLLSHKARYKVEKQETLFGSELVVTEVRSWGEVIDLYDFNHSYASGGAQDAAILQIGYGNGSYGSPRNRGKIFRDRIEFNKPYTELP